MVFHEPTLDIHDPPLCVACRTEWPCDTTRKVWLVPTNLTSPEARHLLNSWLSR